MDVLKGSYVILLELAGEQEIAIGKLGSVVFASGYYAYVGSAMGGLGPRLRRHIRSDKRLHWHIDYLLQRASIAEIIIGESAASSECAIAQKLSRALNHVPEFGCSDCKCKSHLYFCSKRDTLLLQVIQAFNEAQIIPQPWTDSPKAFIEQGVVLESVSRTSSHSL